MFQYQNSASGYIYCKLLLIEPLLVSMLLLVSLYSIMQIELHYHSRLVPWPVFQLNNWSIFVNVGKKAMLKYLPQFLMFNSMSARVMSSEPLRLELN
jgi:hypothetical protein